MTTPELDATLRVPSTDSTTPRPLGHAQYPPGEIIAGRYRIVSLLGSGGMGDVYRADDIKLEQPVALKFLPPALARDAVLLARLHDEVRLGRQVSHPNVCRIYDIGEYGQAHFVAMEYVDGEDLGRLLRRIGRLPADKAVELAHGIAAGIAAAHAKGILHRDLKPANIMIDSHGDARITDFGLALATEDASLGDLAGTPAYMAPEQLEGKPASVQSDLYALGLVMYEMITGRRPYSGKSIAELRISAASATQPPSTHIRDLDPAVERIILRCLSRDPEQRPKSAREILQTLPGGDPIAAAMAAGQTPSPRAVAAAGTEGSLSRRVAWSLAGAAVVMYSVVLAIVPSTSIVKKVPFDKSPDVLDARAKEIAATLGLGAPRFHASGFSTSSRYLGWIVLHDQSLDRWDHFRESYPPLTYTVRLASQPLLPLGDIPFPSDNDPPLTSRGMANVEIDTTGRLIALAAIPTKPREGHPDFRPLLSMAGLDPARLTPSVPRDTLPLNATERAAWSGNFGRTPVRIEAAAAGATPVWFHIAPPWDEDAHAESASVFSGPAQDAIAWPLSFVIAGIAAFLVWNNYRRGRIDRAGAVRLAVFVFLIEAAAFLLTGYHSLELAAEVGELRRMASFALFWAGAYAFLYVALEPHVRRRWPELMISWSRLLTGRWRDPMVGRDVLIGITAGIAHAFLAMVSSVLPPLLRIAPQNIPRVGHINGYSGARFGVGIIFFVIESGIMLALIESVILVALAVVLRRRPLAIAGIYLLHVAAILFVTHFSALLVPFAIVLAALATFLLVRIGMLSLVAFQLGFSAAFSMPHPIDPSAWTFPATLVGVGTLAVVIVFAFRISLGGQPAFSAALLDD